MNNYVRLIKSRGSKSCSSSSFPPQSTSHNSCSLMRHNLIQFLSLLTRIDHIFLYINSKFSSRLCLV